MANERKLDFSKVMGFMSYSCVTCAKWVEVERAIAHRESHNTCHFCGTECYQRWMKKNQNSSKDRDKPTP